MKYLRLCLAFLLSISLPLTTFAQNTQENVINSGGATFPYPLYQKLFQNYKSSTGVNVKYAPIGSGKGYQQLKSDAYQFSASDMFFDNTLLAELPRKAIHIPICLGAVAIAYNLPGNPEIQLNSEIISKIYQGEIKKWNDTKIQTINPAVSLPDLLIVPIHRSNSSGTTYIFTEFLSKTNTNWKEEFGITPSLDSIPGISVENSVESAKALHQIVGGITYQELAYCLANNQTVAKIQNQKGNFIKPSVTTISLAGNTQIPADGRISLTNTDNPNGYPISSFSWIILYKDQNYNNQTKQQAQELAKLVWWMTHDGQKLVEESGYSPLHKKTIETIEQILKGLSYSGKPILD